MSKLFFSSSSEARGIISLKTTTESQQWQFNSKDNVEATMSNKQMPLLHFLKTRQNNADDGTFNHRVNREMIALPEGLEVP